MDDCEACGQSADLTFEFGDGVSGVIVREGNRVIFPRIPTAADLCFHHLKNVILTGDPLEYGTGSSLVWDPTTCTVRLSESGVCDPVLWSSLVATGPAASSCGCDGAIAIDTLSGSASHICIPGTGWVALPGSGCGAVVEWQAPETGPDPIDCDSCSAIAINTGSGSVTHFCVNGQWRSVGGADICALITGLPVLSREVRFGDRLVGRDQNGSCVTFTPPSLCGLLEALDGETAARVMADTDRVVVLGATGDCVVVSPPPAPECCEPATSHTVYEGVGDVINQAEIESILQTLVIPPEVEITALSQTYKGEEVSDPSHDGMMSIPIPSTVSSAGTAVVLLHVVWAYNATNFGGGLGNTLNVTTTAGLGPWTVVTHRNDIFSFFPGDPLGTTSQAILWAPITTGTAGMIDLVWPDTPTVDYTTTGMTIAQVMLVTGDLDIANPISSGLATAGADVAWQYPANTSTAPTGFATPAGTGPAAWFTAGRHIALNGIEVTGLNGTVATETQEYVPVTNASCQLGLAMGTITGGDGSGEFTTMMNVQNIFADPLERQAAITTVRFNVSPTFEFVGGEQVIESATLIADNDASPGCGCGEDAVATITVSVPVGITSNAGADLAVWLRVDGVLVGTYRLAGDANMLTEGMLSWSQVLPGVIPAGGTTGPHTVEVSVKILDKTGTTNEIVIGNWTAYLELQHV